MNSLKPVFIVVALGLVSAVVYVMISGPGEEKAPPPGAAAYTGSAAPGDGGPPIQLGGQAGADALGAPGGPPPLGRATPYASSAPAAADGAPGVGGMAPPYGSAASAEPAPPYGRSARAWGGESDASMGSNSAGGDAPPFGTGTSEPGATDFGPGPAGAGSDSGDAPRYAGAGAGGEASSYAASAHGELDYADAETGRADRANAPVVDPASDAQLEQMFQAFMGEIQEELAAGHLSEAHLALSRFYRRPGLTAEQSSQVTELLDQLAGTVIYSREHHLEPPYVVREGETLEQIAEQYNVPWQLLANINGIDDPQNLSPGEELKVVRGPFRAVVHLQDRELTLMLGNRYAGRFVIGVGNDVPTGRLEGDYQVTDKTVGPSYQGPDGLSFRERDPRNPLGGWWLGLGDSGGRPTPVGLHGTNDPRNVGGSCARGTICLGERDVQDIYGILSVGSRVSVRR